VAIIKGTGEVANALHEAIPKIRRVLQDLGLTGVQVEVAGDLVAIDQVSREHTRKMSA
jgi:hypothetical protein